MTEEERFAVALSEALGSLYRISVIRADGEVQSSHGRVRGPKVARTELSIPRSSCSLIIEFDLGAVDSANRVLQSLAPGQADGGSPGSFTHIDRALDELIAQAEAGIGRRMAEMSRGEKQQVVRYLDEHGAFALRKSVEAVADALGVSRFTVYNYLEAIREA